MGILEKKKVRFAISLGIAIFFFVLTWVVLYFAQETEPFGFYTIGVFFGSFSLIAPVLFFVAFDMLADSEAVALKILRKIFMIVGLVGIVFFCGLGGGLLSGEKHVEPWIFAMSSFWMLGGILTFLFLTIYHERNLPRKLGVFLSPIAYLVAYFVNVIFAYIGNGNSFFYIFFGWILCAAILGFMFFCYRKDILIYAPCERRTSYTSQTQTPEPDMSEADSLNKRIKDKKFPKTLQTEIERVFKERGIYGMPNEYFSSIRWEKEPTVDYWQLRVFTVSVTGKLEYKLAWNDTAEEVERAIVECRDMMGEKIEEAIGEALDNVREKYTDYDTSWQENIGIEVSIREA